MNRMATLGRRAYSAAAEAPKNIFKAREAEAKHASGLISMWKNLSIFVAIPSIGLATYNAFSAQHPDAPEFKQYPFLRKRTKKFPWGDGNHSLFHNSHLNPLPTGYEGGHDGEHH